MGGACRTHGKLGIIYSTKFQSENLKAEHYLEDPSEMEGRY
jgi:hypothetical protein